MFWFLFAIFLLPPPAVAGEPDVIDSIVQHLIVLRAERAALEDQVEHLAAENQMLRDELADQDDALPSYRFFAGRHLQLTVPDLLELDPGEAAGLNPQWDFGENTAFAQVSGFAAGHVYDTPGQYTVTLDGEPFAKVEVLASRAPEQAESWEQVAQYVAARKPVMLPAGVVEVSQTLNLPEKAVLVGHPDGSTIKWVGGKHGVIFNAYAGGILVRNLTFDSRYTEPDKAAPDAIRLGGTGSAILDNTFLHIGTAINGNGQPTNTLVQGNTAPLDAGLKAYFIWGEGGPWAIYGNTVVNSTREHGIRVGGPKGSAGGNIVCVVGNTIGNLDRRDVTDNPDPFDFTKAALKFQKGQYGWAEGNTFTGPWTVGPLGEGDGLGDKEGRWNVAVFRNNRGTSRFEVEHGSNHVHIEGNDIAVDDDTAMELNGWDERYGRGSSDVVVQGNTLRNGGEIGRGVHVQSRIEGLTVRGNTYAAPKLVQGGYNSGGFLSEVDPGENWTIEGNTWPAASPRAWPRGIVNRMNKDWLTISQWQALPVTRDEHVAIVQPEGE